jgi:predicted amidohydrolase
LQCINEPFRVASIQFNPEFKQLDSNIENLLKLVDEAARNGAKLIVTPELATTGYNYDNRKAVKDFTDTIPGKTTKLFSEVAQEYDTYIVVGILEEEQETEIYYNSAFLVGPEGYIGKYRKTHQWETEAHWAAWGDLGIPVYDTKIGRIAINICMDSIYFESARLAALNDADILAFPTNSTAQTIWTLQARAEQNGLYIVGANRSNTEEGVHMIGASAIWSPSGEKLAEAEYISTVEDDIDQSTIIYAEIDPTQYNNQAKARFKERKPDLYKDLMLYIAPWDYTKNMTSHDITAAVLQYEPVIGDKGANIAKIKELIAEAMVRVKRDNKDLDLVVLPELATTGSVKKLKQANQLAETLEGETVEEFRKLAVDNQFHIIWGMIEREHDKLYNSALLLNHEGELLGKYRKTHLNNIDKKWAEAGEKIKVFSSDELGKIGIMIGYDTTFPEVAGVMAVNRADIIAIPTSWNSNYGSKLKANQDIPDNRYSEGAMSLWDSIALSSQAYTLVANFVGAEYNYLGSSALYTLDPLYGLDQPQIASLDKEEVLIVDFSTIQSDWWFNQEKLILSRRTAFYKPLVY